MIAPVDTGRHEAAVAAGDPGYADARTGLFVFTAVALAERGWCCRNGCRHCPWDGTGPPEGERRRASR